MLENTTFWYALCFAVFILLTFRKAKSSCLDILDAHADKVMSEVEDAEKLKRDAHNELLAMKEKQLEIEREAQDLLDRTRVQASEMRKQAQAELELTLKRKEQQTKSRIEQARQNVIQHVRSEMVETAIRAVESSLAESLSSKDTKSLIGVATKELPHHLEGMR